MVMLTKMADAWGPIPVIAGFFLAMYAIKIAKKTIKLALFLGAIAVVLMVLGII